MNADFKEYIPILDANEGGYSDHPKDKGGRTIFGISKRYHPEVFDKIYSLYKTHNEVDLKEAEKLKNEFYKKEYWDMMLCQYLTIQSIANHLCDIAINQGITTAKKIGLLALNLTKKTQHTIYSAIIGDINGLQASEVKKMNNIMVDLRLNRYNAIIEEHPEQKVFLNGWKTRALKFQIK